MLFIVLVFSLTTPFLLNQTKAHCLSSSRHPGKWFAPLGTTWVPLPLDPPRSVGGQGWRPGTLSRCPSGHSGTWAGHLTLLRLGKFISTPHRDVPRVNKSRCDGPRVGAGTQEALRNWPDANWPGALAVTQASWRVTWSQEPIQLWLADCVIAVIFSQGDRMEYIWHLFLQL